MGRTIVRGDFEWDKEKAKLNFKKHGISFEKAIAVFDAPYLVQFYDNVHSSADEERIKAVGVIRGFLVTATIYTERGLVGRKRIISARKADKKERDITMKGTSPAIEMTDEEIKEILARPIDYSDRP